MRSRVLAVVLAVGAGAFSLGLHTTTAQVAPPERIEAAPLATDVFSTGTLTIANGALPATLWRGSSVQTLEFLLENLPDRLPAPSLGEAMRRTLLSPGQAPIGAQPSLGGKKLLALSRAGFVKDAATVASLSSAGRGDPWTGQAEAVNDLLEGDIQAACARSARLTTGRENPFWVKLRVVCYAEAGERDAAELSLGILRDQYGLSPEDDMFLTAAATGVLPKTPPASTDALQFAIARSLDLPISPGLLDGADGGVLAAIAADDAADAATRIAAAVRAVAMGVLSAERFAAMMAGFQFDVAALGNAADAARQRPSDPLTDALIYQSAMAMGAPEFLRDKAQRIATGLSLADSFHRAYALSVLYADEIAALEGVLLAPSEAARFALARMAVGDSVGAGMWLSGMIAPGASVGALPESEAMRFIELVNLLAMLDPQSAAQIARAADVSLLNGSGVGAAYDAPHGDPAVAAHILEAAFDAAIGEKPGQAGLVALAASAAAAPPSGDVIVSQSLRAAGLGDLDRRYRFERAWATQFPAGSNTPDNSAESAAAPEDRGFAPRVKPTVSQ